MFVLKRQFFCIYAGLLATLCVVSPVKIRAQNLPAVVLEEVQIDELYISPFAIGASITIFDSTWLKLESLTSTADLIANYTGLSTRAYGNGMLATISFRGTGPSHTAVLWNGINIAYPMIGQSDLSLISLALVDEIKIQHGTGTALYGSGAIGGTIALESKAMTGTKVSLSQWIGSYGNLQHKIDVGYGTARYFFRLKSFWQRADNDFSYINTTKPGSPVVVQENAGYRFFGTTFDAGVALGNVSKILVSAQFVSANRDLQPPMNAASLAENQTDENLRVQIKYLYKDGGAFDWNISYAYLYDVIGYNGEKTNANQQVLRIETNAPLASWLKASMAADYNLIKVNSPFYSNATEESRTNIWGSVLLSPLARMALNASLRQAFSSAYRVPLTPTLGVEYELIKRTHHQLKLKSMAARGFRVPTLNERFWQPGGNPNLDREDSYSVELGVAGSSGKNIIASYEITGYRMWVDNWILWRPQGNLWSPENIKYVDVYGVEAAGSVVHRIENAVIKWGGNYAYTRSINRTGLDQFDRSVNKQLAYVPVHKATLTGTLDMPSCTFLINTTLTGKRYVTADNENYLPAYLQLNIKASKSFYIKRMLLAAQVNINNVLNTQYQSVENRALPGINFQAGLTISYHKP